MIHRILPLPIVVPVVTRIITLIIALVNSPMPIALIMPMRAVGIAI